MNSDRSMPALDDDLELWLNLLADDELTPAQKRELIHYLNAHPEHWKRCARAFLDQQTLKTTFRPASDRFEPEVGVGQGFDGVQELAGPTVVRRVKSRSRDYSTRSRFWANVLAMAGCIALLGFVSYLAGNKNGKILGRQELQREFDQAIHSFAQRQKGLDGELPPNLTLASTELSSQCELLNRFQGQPLLIELENTPSHALYLTNREIPRSLLDCFVAAGYEVEVKPYEPKFMNPFSTPVVALEVSKRSTFQF